MKMRIISFITIIAVLMPLMSFSILAIPESTHAKNNYEHIISASYVTISYDLEIIVAYYAYGHQGYVLYNFNGNPLNNHRYDYIEYSEDNSYIVASYYMSDTESVRTLEDVHVFKQNGKQIDIEKKDEKIKKYIFDGNKCYFISDAETYVRFTELPSETSYTVEKSKFTEEIDLDKSIVTMENNCFIVRDRENLKGYIFNIDGILRYKFEGESSLSENYIRLKNPENNKYGITNFYGELTVEYKYDEMFANSGNENYVAAKKDGKWGAIDYEGNILVDFKLNSVPFASEDFLVCNINGNNNIININSKEIIHSAFESHYIRIEKTYPDTEMIVIGYYDASKSITYGGKYGIISYGGDIILPVEYDEIGDLSEGLMYVKKDNLYGFADMNGLKIPLIYSYVTNYSEGLAGVGINYSEEERKGIYSKWSGYINKENEIVIDLGSERMAYRVFSEGMAAVGYKYSGIGGNCEYIDKNGKVVMSRAKDDKYGEWWEADPFKRGITVVSDSITMGSSASNGMYAIRYTGNIPSPWAEKYVNEAKNMGIIPEHLQDLYKDNITRAEFVDIAIRYVDLYLRNKYSDSETYTTISDYIKDRDENFAASLYI